MAGAPSPVVVAIAGGSGSGKTTLAEALAQALMPRRALLLREDDYYQDHGALPGFEAACFNFDDVAAHDHALLAHHLGILRAGGTVEGPRYCFVSHRRQAGTRRLEPTEIVILEGVHVLCSAALRRQADLRVYLDVPDDIRLARRLLRDVRERGREPATVVAQYLASVRPMHYLHTHPSRLEADLLLGGPTGEPALDRLLAPLLDRVQALLS